MVKQTMRGVLFAMTLALGFSLISCGGTAEQKKTITYKCLSSSCDATVTCNVGDPVPTHCGKKMIQ
jgi:hypothetical protein